MERNKYFKNWLLDVCVEDESDSESDSNSDFIQEHVMSNVVFPDRLKIAVQQIIHLKTILTFYGKIGTFVLLSIWLL